MLRHITEEHIEPQILLIFSVSFIWCRTYTGCENACLRQSFVYFHALFLDYLASALIPFFC